VMMRVLRIPVCSLQAATIRSSRVRGQLHLVRAASGTTEAPAEKGVWDKFCSWAFNEKDPNTPLPAMLESPHQHLRNLAQQYQEGGTCPVSGGPLLYSCPRSGFPTHSSKASYDSDSEHNQYVEELQLIHSDLADLYSGRAFPEFKYPGPPRPGQIELVNWMKFFLDRKFKWNDDMRSARHLSQMFTWPLTIAFALQEISGGIAITDIAKSDRLVLPVNEEGVTTLNIHALGARQEAALPDRVWQELQYLCPDVNISLRLIGPEIPGALDGKVSTLASPMADSQSNFALSFHQCLYEDLPEEIPPADVFVVFNSGIGYQREIGDPTWDRFLADALASRVPIILSSFNEADAARDKDCVKALQAEHDCQILFAPEENPFMSMKKDAARNNYRYMVNSNYSLQVISGK